MYTFIFFLFLVTLCVSKSEVEFETMCRNDFRNEKNKRINVLEYCSDKLCIQKCCGPDELMFNSEDCEKYTQFHNKTLIQYPYLKPQYDSINILSSWKTNNATKYFEFVQNQRNVHYLLNCTADIFGIYNISEDGSLWIQDSESEKMSKRERLTFCIDYNVVAIDKKNETLIAAVEIVIKENIIQDSDEDKQIDKFETIGLIISSLFLLLVLVVYCLLPGLRNLTGLVLMACTFARLIGFIAKLILIFILKQTEYTLQITCKKLTPLIYFGFVSSIFWMSVYAFDVWWGLRCLRIKRGSKRGDQVKFMWYSLYAWGTPLLLTATIVTLDNLSNLNLNPSPPFQDCLTSGFSLDLYYKIPIGILILINIVLFCMTVYNIWKVKRGVTKCHESGSNKQQSNKFSTYAKLCLMMGVSWFLELLPPQKTFWEYIIINMCNLLTGVIIFYLFVCKKIILLQLCKKFNIQNNYIKNLEVMLVQKRTKSGATRSTTLSSSIIKRKSKDQPQPMVLLQNCREGENTVA